MYEVGFVSLHRKIKNWEWYKDVNTFKLFVHCLIEANWTPARFRGHLIPRGSFVTSIRNLADGAGLSIQECRTSLNRLKSTRELTQEVTHDFSIINVVNYDVYQDNNFETNTRTNTQTNMQLTCNQQQYNNINNNNNINNLSLENVERIIKKNSYKVDAEEFIDCYKGQKIKNLKALLKSWNDNANKNANSNKRGFNNYTETFGASSDEQIMKQFNKYKKKLEE